MRLASVSIASALLFAISGCSDEPTIQNGIHTSDEPMNTVSLAQGWTANQQRTAWFTSFGSRLMPYAWFMALEQPTTEAPFAQQQYLSSFGFLPEQSSAKNPDGLPVVFARDERESEHWIGLNCAACHTGEIVVDGPL